MKKFRVDTPSAPSWQFGPWQRSLDAAILSLKGAVPTKIPTSASTHRPMVPTYKTVTNKTIPTVQISVNVAAMEKNVATTAAAGTAANVNRVSTA
jgi:hypothetical protein